MLYRVLFMSVIAAISVGFATIQAFKNQESNKRTVKLEFLENLTYGVDKFGNCYAVYGTRPYLSFTSVNCENIEIMNKKMVEKEMNFEKAVEEMRRKDQGY